MTDWKDIGLDEYADADDERRGEMMLEVVNRIEDLTSAHLEMLIEHAEDALKRAKEREAKAAMEELEAVAKKHGFDIEDLVARKAQQMMLHEGTSEPVRFRHPNDATLTWTGRGRLPAWLKEIKDAGGDIEKFRVRA